jgi:hypothetical protein
LVLSPLLFWWLYWLSAPGVAVAVLGFVAVVMAFRAEQSSAKERAIWIVISFALLLLEIWAVRKERREETEHFDRTFSRFADVQKNMLDAESENKQYLAHIQATLEAMRSQTPSLVDSVTARVTRLRDRAFYLSADILKFLDGRDSQCSNCDAETVVLYKNQFLSQVLEIRAGLEQRGLPNEKLKTLVENTTNSGDIRTIAEGLAELAGKLPSQ